MYSLQPCLILLLCAQAEPPQSADGKDSEPTGIVFIAGGVGGIDILAKAANKGLPRAGITHEIQDFRWTHGTGHVLEDLQDTKHLWLKAGELAAQVLRYRKKHPDRPIYLVGKSGGTGIVLTAAALLPHQSVERIILLSPAVSPHFDLRPALRATRKEVVSFHSSSDWLILGWGTSRFGTIDRVHGPSAGLKGFVRPREGADLDLYDRLVQIHWQPRMILGGHAGGHAGTSMPSFLAKEVAPWLKVAGGKKPKAETVPKMKIPFRRLGRPR